MVVKGREYKKAVRNSFLSFDMNINGRNWICECEWVRVCKAAHKLHHVLAIFIDMSTKSPKHFGGINNKKKEFDKYATHTDKRHPVYDRQQYTKETKSITKLGHKHKLMSNCQFIARGNEYATREKNVHFMKVNVRVVCVYVGRYFLLDRLNYCLWLLLLFAGTKAAKATVHDERDIISESKKYET